MSSGNYMLHEEKFVAEIIDLESGVTVAGFKKVDTTSAEAPLFFLVPACSSFIHVAENNEFRTICK